MTTRSFYRIGIICFFLVWAFWASPALCLDLNTQNPEARKTGHSDTVLPYLSFFEISRNQVISFHTNIKTWVRGGLDEFLLKRTVVTTELLNRHPASADSPSTRFENTSGTSIKQPVVTNPATPNNVAYMFDNLRSPILAPYKYKTNNNSLLSIVIPFDATDHLTVAPIISYVFSLNGSDRYDLNYKTNAVSDLKDNSLFYGGINFIYKF